MESNEPSKNTGRVVITRPVRRTRPKGRNETVSYIKYGDEWYNEVMKNKKSVIVDMLRRVAMRCDELEAAQHSVQPYGGGWTDNCDYCDECGAPEYHKTHCSSYPVQP
jgi:hypothetical protein